MSWAGASNSTKDFSKGDVIKLGDDDLVAHVTGSGEDKSNWKAFWISKSDLKWPKKCQIFSCGNTPSVGAHVYIKNMKGNKFHFILPTCQSCNKDPDSHWDGSKDNWVSAKQGAVVVATLAKDCAFEIS